MMRWSNPFYRRKWPRLAAPFSTFFVQFGRRWTSELGNNHEQPIEHNSTLQIDSNSDPSPSRSEAIYHQLEEGRMNQQTTLIPILTNPLKSTLKDNFSIIFFVSLIYFAWFILIAGLSWIHGLIYMFLLGSYLLCDRTRRFMFAVLIYLAYLFFYDALHLVPNYSISPVHIQDIYLLEKNFFGVYANQQLMTWNEYFQKNHVPFLDLLTGFCYLNWIPIPVAYSIYLYNCRGKREYMDFALTFLLTNLFGFVIYYIIPTAPPWYIESYGFEFNIKAVGNPAGFIHFDQITGLKIFSSIYSKNANVFAAIPSLHAAYPFITVLYGSLSRKFWLHIGFVIFTLSVWFSAVYSRHHYIVDVLAGGLCALSAFLFYRFVSRRSPFDRFLDAYSKLI